MKKLIIISVFILILSGCVIQGKTTYQEVDDPIVQSAMAQLALTNFLGFLNQNQFEQASYIYDGSLDVLKRLNPNEESETKLLENYCTMNQGACLIPKVTKAETITSEQYKFTVEFYQADGTLYKTPGCPCKGGGKSSFEFNVIKNGAQYLVPDLPPRVESGGE